MAKRYAAFLYGQMTRLFILILSICYLKSSGQKTIDWTLLIGHWKIDKQFNFHDNDTTSPLTPEKTTAYSFEPSQQFTFTVSGDNTKYTGKYIANQPKGTISFVNLIQTTKFPGTPHKDFVGPGAPWPDIFVLKLTADIFVFYQKGCDDAEGTNCGSVTYLTRIK